MCAVLPDRYARCIPPNSSTQLLRFDAPKRVQIIIYLIEEILHDERIPRLCKRKPLCEARGRMSPASGAILVCGGCDCAGFFFQEMAPFYICSGNQTTYRVVFRLDIVVFFDWRYSISGWRHMPGANMGEAIVGVQTAQNVGLGETCQSDNCGTVPCCSISSQFHGFAWLIQGCP